MKAENKKPTRLKALLRSSQLFDEAAIIPTSEPEDELVRRLPITNIVPNPENKRHVILYIITHFNEWVQLYELKNHTTPQFLDGESETDLTQLTDLNEIVDGSNRLAGSSIYTLQSVLDQWEEVVLLARNIALVGNLIQPIHLIDRSSISGPHYMLFHGHRRLLACMIAKHEYPRCTVANTSIDDQYELIRFSENHFQGTKSLQYMLSEYVSLRDLQKSKGTVTSNREFARSFGMSRHEVDDLEVIRSKIELSIVPDIFWFLSDERKLSLSTAAKIFRSCTSKSDFEQAFSLILDDGITAAISTLKTQKKEQNVQPQTSIRLREKASLNLSIDQWKQVCNLLTEFVSDKSLIPEKIESMRDVKNLLKHINSDGSSE